MKNIILFLLVFIISCDKKDNQSAQHLHQDHKTVSQKIANLMHAPMMDNKFQVTSNPDLDFLVNMIPHHNGAILSAEEYIQSGTDEAVKMLASNIIEAQKAEVAEFENIISKMKKDVAYDKMEVEKFAKNSQKEMENMMKAMNSVKLTEDINKDFLMLMVPHHQGAIDASKSILKISTNDTIKEIANRIIRDQEREIKEIHSILSNL